MSQQELIQYIKSSLNEGYNREAVKNILLHNGHSQASVEEAFDIVDGKKQAWNPNDKLNPENISKDREANQITQENKEKDKMNLRIFYARYMRKWLHIAFFIVIIIILIIGVMKYRSGTLNIPFIS